ncbi:MAG: acyl-CoA dehydrogenase family protein [Rubrivivax sp.]|jgi:putative acyl-CoA dehydrogenase|nr:acyl-CoA dehydrogenase family protein [Rubrivivax sp.]
MTPTHTVTNQSTPFTDVNLFTSNQPLQDALKHHHPGFDQARFQALGELCGSAEMQAHARLANTQSPRLLTHDRFGRRIDQVEFHPSYHALLEAACAARLHGSPWAEGPGGHIERAAAFMLFTELEPSVLCPVSMTYAVAPSLRANPAVHAAFGPGLVAPRYDPRFTPHAAKHGLTMGMGMTEKQGGSDVRANTTRAEFDGEDAWGQRYRLTGHKWFFSAPMCDAFLVLAQAQPSSGVLGSAGTSAAGSRAASGAGGGLSCFFLPRWRPDGSVNPLHIQRLKNKLGNQANASSEVEFEGTHAWLVGEVGRGVPQILAMGALTRLDCALGTAGLMRQALSLALHHTAQRHAFGKPLIDQPLMKAVLADLAMESEAATALALRLAAAVDHSENGHSGSAATSAIDPAHEAVMRRLLTPVAKFWICKRGSLFAQEAMECLGGNGYVEEQGEGVMARIYREMPLNSIWEGAGNIMALDLMRALRGHDVAAALVHECTPALGADSGFDRARDCVLLAVEQGVEEVQARQLARDLAVLLQAAQLFRHAPLFVFEAFCASRLASTSDAFGLLPAGLPLDALIARAMPVERP